MLQASQCYFHCPKRTPQSISCLILGAEQGEFPLSEEKLRHLSKNLYETNSQLDFEKQADLKRANEGTESITYIEYENEQEQLSNLSKQLHSAMGESTKFCVSFFYAEDILKTLINLRC